jgi:hypothetical protein
LAGCEGKKKTRASALQPALTSLPRPLFRGSEIDEYDAAHADDEEGRKIKGAWSGWSQAKPAAGWSRERAMLTCASNFLF